MDHCQVFELNGSRYALLGPIYPSFGTVQLLDVVELEADDYITPNRLPRSAEISIGDEGPYVIVRNEHRAHDHRQARAMQLAVTVSVANTARAQLEAIDESEGRGLSG